MRRWIRNPLTWIVIAELVVVSALIAVTWNMLAGPRPALASPVLRLPGTAAEPSETPLPEGAGKPPAQRGPLPGVNLDSAFWQTRLHELNRDQAYFEQLEWRIVHAAMDAIKRYVDRVVLPSVRRATVAS
jgi:hypothetical protein